MPFRQLPRSDGDRLQALEAAAAKAAAVDPADLAFTAATKTTLDATLPQFRTELQERGTALGAQVEATTALTAQRERLRMWTSHFFQNLNFGVARGVFQAGDRAFFQLPTSQESLPGMSSEADLLMWSQRVVDGETARVAAGGTAIPFPTSTEVGAERATYVTLQADQSTKRDAADSEQEDVEALRDSIDELVADIWDEVEFTFRKDAPPSLRAKAREYGVVYVPRPGEPPEENGGGGPAVQTTPYNTGIVGTDTEVWINVPADLVDIQTLVLIHDGTPFFTAFSPMPGTVAKTTWPGMVISGAIDEVKIQNGASEDIAVGEYDPMLVDPGP